MREIAACLMLGVAVLMPASVRAQQPTVQQQRVACTPDALRLCSHEIPNLGRIIQCLRTNKANLSSQCRQMFDIADGRRSTTRSTSTVDGVTQAWCPAGRAGDPPVDVWAAWCDEAGITR